LKKKLYLNGPCYLKTDGETEHLNKTLEIILKHYCCSGLHDWTKNFSVVKFAYNHSPHSSSGQVPFMLKP